MYIDTHSHLDYNSFDEDRESVIQRAIKNKVDMVITIGTDVKSSEMSVKLADKFATVYAAVGIHPNDCTEASEKSLQRIEELSSSSKVIAIGEIGLDYYRDFAPKDRQIKFFREQLQIAGKVKLPVIIHNREAHEDLYDILIDEKASDLNGVLHSFDGDSNFLDSMLSLNFYISLTGVVTFKNSNYDEIIERVPLDNLLLETDSPFLAPMPFRGKRNEPAYVKYIAEKIAQVKDISVEELAQITSDNAKNLFNFNKK
ncbi:TatD family hydrolase [Calditrichota bacterium]